MLSVSATILIDACATKTNLPQSRPTLEIYHSASAEDISKTKSSRALGYREESSLHNYSRSEVNFLDIQFPVLPNPTIGLYVFPYIKNNAPIPGYVTKFQLYESDKYALPGEE